MIVFLFVAVLDVVKSRMPVWSTVTGLNIIHHLHRPTRSSHLLNCSNNS